MILFIYKKGKAKMQWRQQFVGCWVGGSEIGFSRSFLDDAGRGPLNSYLKAITTKTKTTSTHELRRPQQKQTHTDGLTFQDFGF